MRLTEAMVTNIDLELAKKALLILSAACLVLIPLDGVRLSLEGPKSRKTKAIVAVAPPAGLEAERSYLESFEASTLFGNGSSVASAPALQASLTELTKDYRLKGVVLTDDSEAIIEDARTQKTLFVKKGAFLGDLAVNEIGEGFIVLSYLGSEKRLEIQ